MKFLGSIKYTEALPQPSRRAFNLGISEQTIAALKVRISPVSGHVKKRSSSNIEITMIMILNVYLLLGSFDNLVLKPQDMFISCKRIICPFKNNYN